MSGAAAKAGQPARTGASGQIEPGNIVAGLVLLAATVGGLGWAARRWQGDVIAYAPHLRPLLDAFTTWATPAAAGLTGIAVLMAVVTAAGGRRRRRGRRLHGIAAAAIRARPDQLTVNAKWRANRPTRGQVGYPPGAIGVDPSSDLAERLTEVYGQPYTASWQPMADIVAFHTADAAPASTDEPMAEDTVEAAAEEPLARAQQIAAGMLGNAQATVVTADPAGEPTEIRIVYAAAVKDASPAMRERMAAHAAGKMPGGAQLWRAELDPTRDTLTLRRKPALPTYVLHPPSTTTKFPSGSLVLPYATDETGNACGWDLNAAVPHALVIGPTGGGKLLALDTPIPTPAGRSTMGDLVDGDQVFDDTGQACTVIKAHDVQHNQVTYEVVFSDGSVIVAGADHLWWTEDRADRVARFDHRDVDTRRVTPRARRLDEAALARLAAAAAAAAGGDSISLPEAGRLAGMGPTHPALRRLATQVSPCGTRRPSDTRAFVYREQCVRQTQRVGAFARQPALQWLTTRASSAGWRFPGTAEQLHQQPSNEEMITSLELRDLLGTDKAGVEAAMRRSGLPRTLLRRDVTLRVPARTVTRRNPQPPVTVYPTAQLLTALIGWGSGLMRDRHQTRPAGQVRTTEEIRATLRTPSGHVNHAVPVAAAVQYPPAEQPIPAYVLGVWLGDGGSWRPEITCADPQIAQLLTAEGMDVVDRGRPATKPESYRARLYTLRGIRRDLDQLGLLRCADPARRPRTKHIPACYLHASEPQRRALLAGLLDTDGTVAHGGAVQFDNTNPLLARQVRELACSLGYRATLREGRAKLYGRDCGPKWTVAFTTADDVFRLDRKRRTHAARVRRHNPERTRVRYIVDVRPVPSVPMRCITVDSPSRLYLAGETFIPTHNTVLLRGVAMEAVRKGAEVWGCDPKRIELKGLRGWPGVTRVATGIEEMVELIGDAHALMEARYARIEAGHALREDLRPLVVILDEYLILVASANRHWKATKEKGQTGTAHPVLGLVKELVVLARSARIHLCLGVQRPDATLFDDGARDSIRHRVSLARLSPQGAMMLWEDPRTGTDLDMSIRGRATAITSSGSPGHVQVWWTPDPDPHVLARNPNAHSPAETTCLQALRPTGEQPDSVLLELPAARRAVAMVNVGGDRLTATAEDAQVVPDDVQDAVRAADLEPGQMVLLDFDDGQRAAVIEDVNADPDHAGDVLLDFRETSGEPGMLALAGDDLVFVTST